MPLSQLIVLAIIQGLTEFLPISSSGHLALVDELTGWADQGVLIDMAIHVGSLFAVLIYFRKDVLELIGGAWMLLRGEMTEAGRLVLYLVGASVPIFVVGFAVVSSGLVDGLRGAATIAWANMVFALLLYWGDRAGGTSRTLREMSWGQALIIGLSQIAAIMPGASRSGVTMTAARFLGFDRKEAARFSMLLAIPTILGAGAATAMELIDSGNTTLQTDAVIAAFLSFLAAWLSIAVFMRLLENISLTPFVIYRVVLGAALLGWLYLG
ncbi:undecaprenyl-diphosphate phosphatase [Pyruvatibacter mobilis]|uniref:Undecaprenyl-diphosphatase n=1 Tax=Pyruvatibacter mobilis TaxID=1712261 RepID=A0A845Q8X6_9HYPH|nr:undecaprenyl-diphosphate phosphatase [Pyruvatibacter mobilis]NBG94904.1 undecaprenyl-diphosphate phosphatase [Pyruvatibacter mobilis]QJD76120.1 undecaprenyl-diphosphate phosphatase [Pyruvatibacter mobilis]GGD21346.1 undecaprenyl-diphosphatase 1 [Pyruvatibacter mobilis]